MIKETPPNACKPVGSWGRYQKAYYNWISATGGENVKHAGNRSKLCSKMYAEFKLKPENEQRRFLDQWA